MKNKEDNRIAVFASHNGSDLQAIIDCCKKKDVRAQVVLVISNNSNSYAIVRARNQQIAAYHVSEKTEHTVEGVEKRILSLLEKYQVDTIFLAGYLKKIGETILEKYDGHIYNIHPSLLPAYGGKGMYGLNVHKAVLENKEKKTGITIHEVNSHYDMGKIIAQKEIDVFPTDTATTLSKRVLEEEHEFLMRFIENLCK